MRWTVKAVTPPILLLGLKRIAIGLGLRKREVQGQLSGLSLEPPPQGQSSGLSPQSEAPPEWEFVPEGWARPAPGWAVDAVARAYREKWPAYLAAIEAPSPLGVHHETAEVQRDDSGAHNMLVSFAYVLARAGRGRERISVLDWGGGLGHYHALARSVVPDLHLDYHCKETPVVCTIGRELQPEVVFHENDSCLEPRYDLVVASSSLQYEQDWQSLLGRLAGAAERYLYVARVPVALRGASFVVLQRAHAYGYETEYLGWVLDRTELLARAEAFGLQLTRELLLDARFSASGAPEDPVEHRSFLFNR